GGGAPPCGVGARRPAEAIVGTGFPFRRKERIPRYLAVLEGSLRVFEDLRRPGAASLDLAWVACGVFDGFFELGLAPWDVAAGGLLIEEAGGGGRAWGGGPGVLDGGILAGGPGRPPPPGRRAAGAGRAPRHGPSRAPRDVFS